MNNRYLFGTALIMEAFSIMLLVHTLKLSHYLDTIIISLILFGIIFIFIHAVLGNANQKIKNILEFIALSSVFFAIIFTTSWEIGLYVGILCIIFILKGVNTKFSVYYYSGIVFLILNILIQFKNYWASIPAWAYILIGGLILVGFVAYKEYRNIKPKIKEVKEIKDEIEEVKEEKKEIKTVSSEIVIVAVFMLLITYANVNALINKISYIESKETRVHVEM